MRWLMEHFKTQTLKGKLSWCVIIASALIIVCLSITGGHRTHTLDSMSMVNQLKNQKGGNLAVMTVIVRAFAWDESILGYRYGLSRTANVDYVISLSDVMSENFKLDDDNLVMRLPAPMVDATTLIPETESRDIELRDGHMSFISKRKISNAAVRKAQDAIKTTIEENNKDLVAEAKSSALSVLKGMYRNVGVKNVEIRWE